MKKTVLVLLFFLSLFLAACASTTTTATPAPTAIAQSPQPTITIPPTTIPTVEPISPMPIPEPTGRQPYRYDDYGLPPECSCFINAAWPSEKLIWEEIFYPKTNWIPLTNCRVLGDSEIVYWPWDEDDPAESCIVVNVFVSISRRGGHFLFFSQSFQPLNPSCDCHPSSLRVGGKVIVVTEDGLYFSPATEIAP